MSTAPSSSSRPGSAPTADPGEPVDDGAERRTLVWAAVGFFGVLLLMLLAVVVVAGDAGDERSSTVSTEACPADDAACEAARDASARPGIIPEPGSGRAPDDAGDPGGALQLALFALIVLGLATIVALVVRSGRRARRARASAPRPPSP